MAAINRMGSSLETKASAKGAYRLHRKLPWPRKEDQACVTFAMNVKQFHVTGNNLMPGGL
jgi:hypothetical protein